MRRAKEGPAGWVQGSGGGRGPRGRERVPSAAPSSCRPAPAPPWWRRLGGAGRPRLPLRLRGWGWWRDNGSGGEARSGTARGNPRVGLERAGGRSSRAAGGQALGVGPGSSPAGDQPFPLRGLLETNRISSSSHLLPSLVERTVPGRLSLGDGSSGGRPLFSGLAMCHTFFWAGDSSLSSLVDSFESMVLPR